MYVNCLQIQAVCNFRSKTGVATSLRHNLASSSDRADMEVYFPPKDELEKKKVVVTTLVSAGRSDVLWIVMLLHELHKFKHEVHAYTNNWLELWHDNIYNTNV